MFWCKYLCNVPLVDLFLDKYMIYLFVIAYLIVYYMNVFSFVSAEHAG